MKAARAFTLAELLVAAAIVIVMTMLLMRLLSGVSSAALLSWERRACDHQAEVVFEQLAHDLSTMLRRRDLDSGFEKHEGNDCFSFYAQVIGYGADDTHPHVSLLGYRIQEGSPGRSGLVRGAQNCDWVSMVYAGVGFSEMTPPNTLPEIQAANYQGLASSICRMEFWFRLKDGSLSESWRKPGILHQLSAASAPTAYDDVGRGYEPGSWWVEKGGGEYVCTDNGLGRAQWQRSSAIENIDAVVVALAVIQTHGQESPDLEAVANVLQDFDGESGLLAKWRQQLEETKPAALRPGAAVRFYERTFYISPL